MSVYFLLILLLPVVVVADTNSNNINTSIIVTCASLVTVSLCCFSTQLIVKMAKQCTIDLNKRHNQRQYEKQLFIEVMIMKSWKRPATRYDSDWPKRPHTRDEESQLLLGCK